MNLSPANFLAVSGGGDDGAFGAGLICGWSDSGKMPSSKLVTGVSTGSMIAPFAFLGGPYVDRLRTLYTTIKPEDISEDAGLFGPLFGEALADTEPLARLISRYVDQQMLADIAREYARGRLLLIGTTVSTNNARSSGTWVQSQALATRERSNSPARCYSRPLQYLAPSHRS